MKEAVLREIAEKWQTPMYIFEEAVLKDNYESLERAYKAFYPNFQIAYSLKTNYTPAVCRHILDMGGFAEVVSGMEYRLAKKVGFLPEQIIVNGPGKWNSIPQMLNEGALVILDNMAELDYAVECAAENAGPARIGFRLNFPIEGGKNSRFGFDIEGAEIALAVEKARSGKNVQIEGVHFHLSGARSLSAWKYRAEMMIALAQKLLKESELRYIDLGSGMFGRMETSLAAQFGQPIPSFEEYAQAVAGTFREYYRNVSVEKHPILVVEPGTTLIANAVSYLTKVLAVKTVRGRHIAITDGSAHQVGELCKKKKLPVRVISCGENQSLKAPVELTGYTCLEDDIMHPECPENVGIGDLIYIQNTGSYSNVLAPPFIQEGCMMVEYKQDGNLRMIRRKQTMEEMLSTYVFE